MATKRELLASVPLFSACSSKELAHIARLADRISARADEVLAEEGSVGREFFVIERGQAAVSIGGKKVATLGPGEFFGEMALLDEQARVATVTAAGPMVLYVIKETEFTRFLEESPALIRRILTGVAERLRIVEKAPTYAWKH